MVPKAEEFILDVRRAARLEQKPTVTTDSELIKPDVIAKALHRAAIWLTPKTVSIYDPAEFTQYPSELQTHLRTAVERFRDTASKVPPDQPATNGQFKEGLDAFHNLTAAVREIVQWDWQKAAATLIDQAEAWSAEFGWRTRRVDKKLGEVLLGEYSVQQLQLYADALYVLDPIARFVPGALGAFDLSIQPSFYVTSVYRHFDGAWYLHLDVGQGVKPAHAEPWSKDSFRRSLEELRSLL